MNWMTFIGVILFGEALVFLQGFTSFLDGYLYRRQMCEGGCEDGTSFLEHGEMWAMALLITPWVAYLMGTHSFAYASGFTILVGALGLWIVISAILSRRCKAPGPYTYVNGIRTVTSDVHVVQLAFATWIIIMSYMSSFIEPRMSEIDITITTILVAVWAVSWWVTLID